MVELTPTSTLRALSVNAVMVLALTTNAATPPPVAETTHAVVTGPARSAPPLPTADRTRRSWNSHVRCRATVTTLRQVLGKVRNRYGGAAKTGGQFRPGIPDRTAFRPPCHRHGVPTFVQLNRVRVGSCSKINEDGDWTCTLTDPTTPARRSEDMKSIHIETDQKFRNRSGWSIPPAQTDINVQGFVFWDAGHTAEAWHHHSGWELHSFTAWRRF